MDANPRIKAEYSLYQRLLDEAKVAPSPIQLEKKKNNKKLLAAQVKVKHPTITADIELLATVRDSDGLGFAFGLRASHLCVEPFFRFDSDGLAHRNDLDEIPLPEQQVTTPHFHRFNENGISLAYKTEALKNPLKAQEIVRDINFGLAHFSQEAHLASPPKEYPEILGLGTPSLFPAESNFDPLEGVKFNER